MAKPKKAPFKTQDFILLETNIDDMTGEQLAHAITQLMGAGALDACLIPIIAKKGRPANILQVSCDKKTKEKLLELILRNTTTTGVRETTGTRHVLERRKVGVQTPYGKLNAKIAWNEEKMILKAKPEYDDAAAAAKKHKASLKEVQDAVSCKLRKKIE